VKYSRIPSGRLHATFKIKNKNIGHIRAVSRDPKVFGEDIDPIIQNPDIVLTGNSPITKKKLFLKMFMRVDFKFNIYIFMLYVHCTVSFLGPLGSFVRIIRR